MVPPNQQQRGPSKEERDALTKQKAKNVHDIVKHLENDISTTIEDDHCFFSKLQDKKDHFEALLKDSFVPQSISDSDDETHHESMSQRACNCVSVKEDEDDKNIVICDRGTQKIASTLHHGHV